ncbi:LamG-like jellyroll fold domain-containing protein [Coraliomargarita algicola]|uniref:LamG-like jellyroll fold domain-containing protein n=1 Tax=Coraliomargarita algicola TaxID=3092156 RepID=A0ABZ0RLG9_9BACT|nr:LamG-like jellyroll fold domain-containing protein [Coraliomargarita sp. J2-16]WPJ95615.1 LamG-like jellyroll fold domain-containing protein [Coraliomargarita sp. J2-16]
MMEHARQDFLLSDYQPADFPGLVSYWEFSQSSETFTAQQGEPYVLRSQVGPLEVVADASAPLGASALRIETGQWLNIARSECPLLDIHGPEGQLTVVAWIKREDLSRGCEFIAGQWNESHRGRQYGLFLNIATWGTSEQICGHLSHVGGPTPGYKYCIDGPMGASPVPYDEWVMVAMSYDGSNGYAWLNGQLDARPGLNPYSLAGGLYDSGPNGSDFTVGAVDRSGVIGNFFSGWLAGLAVYRRALTPAEIYALSQL